MLETGVSAHFTPRLVETDAITASVEFESPNLRHVATNVLPIDASETPWLMFTVCVTLVPGVSHVMPQSLDLINQIAVFVLVSLPRKIAKATDTSNFGTVRVPAVPFARLNGMSQVPGSRLIMSAGLSMKRPEVPPVIWCVGSLAGSNGKPSSLFISTHR